MKENIKELAQAEFKNYIAERGGKSDHELIVWQHEVTFMDAVNWTLKHLISNQEANTFKMEISHKTKRLFEFVKEQHGSQTRKYNNEPYVNHLWRVAQTVSQISSNEWLICVALCHDLFEDTPCDEKLLRAKLIELGFSGIGAKFICNGVTDLTDYFTKERFPALNRRERKEKEAQRLWSIPEWAQTIKYADLLDNTKSIVENDQGFAKTYIEEKKYILLNMRDGNKELLKRLENTIP